MADIKSKEARSRNMAAIKGKNTRPEEIVRQYLFSNGFRYRKNDKRLPGTPDIVLPKYKTVIFVNGCFWHGHTNCKYFVWPENNMEFWRKKIESNILRDNKKIAQLRSLNWRVIVIWECQLKPKLRQQSLAYLVNEIVDGKCEDAKWDMERYK